MKRGRNPKPADSTPTFSTQTASLVRRHFGVGWWGLAIFATLGIVLEALHAFKVGWFLDGGQEVRRLMWRLAHAHGTFLSLVHVAFAATIQLAELPIRSSIRIAAGCLTSATLLVPGGFLLGGMGSYSGDPGVGIVLLPIGAALLLAGVVLTAMQTKLP